METKIKCRKCGRIMDFWEFLPYIEVYLAKLTVETGLAALLFTALKNYFSSNQKTRGIINDHSAKIKVKSITKKQITI